MPKSKFYYPDPISVAIRDFQAKSGDSWKHRGGWTVCEINVNKLKKALKDGWKFIYKIADILPVYIFHFKYHSYMYYTIFTCICYFYIFKVQLGDIS